MRDQSSPTRESVVCFGLPHVVLVALVALFVSAQALAAAGSADYQAAIREFEDTTRAELSRGLISGLSVTLVDDQQIVYANGFGFADKARRHPAKRDTIYRCGSISKLFTAIAAMQLVEQGKLDLDKPVTDFAPDFRIVNPFPDAKPVTLRQSMCHRSGLVREAPVGGYFDDSEPGMAKTVASLASCVMVYPPDSKTKYSNSGVTVVGHVVERVSGEPFAAYQQRHVLGPLGMASSAFLMNRQLRPRLAKGYLPVADGKGGFREIEAPPFELGTIAAGNLYTTAEDLGRFLTTLFARGRVGERRLLKAETLTEMFTPQLTKETNGFGLGFNIGRFRGRKTVNHTGAVYGFTSLISGMPEEKLGVVILCNDDIATGPVRKLGALGLSLLLEAKLGEKPPPPTPPVKMSAAELAAFAGGFESESFWAELNPGEGVLQADISCQRMTLTPIGPLKFEANGRLGHEVAVVFERDSSGHITGFSALNQKFQRVDPPRVPAIPADWRRFLGSYGPKLIPLIVSERYGHLYAMTENEYDNRLWPLNRTVFKMPPGLYTDEQLVFQSDARGSVHSAVLANMPLKRRH